MRGRALCCVFATILVASCERDPAPEAGPEAGQEVLLAMVGNEPVTLEAFEAQLSTMGRPPTDLSHTYALLRKFLAREAMFRAIATQDLLTESELDVIVSEGGKELVERQYMEKHLKRTLTPSRVKEFYENNIDKYSDESRHVGQIVFRLDDGISDEERAQERAKATEAVAELRRGTPFATVFEKYAEGPGDGGDLGWLFHNTAPRGVSRAFHMETGEVSGPLDERDLFRIVQVIDGPRLVPRPFLKEKSRVEQRLGLEARAEELLRLQELAPIVIKPGTYLALKKLIAAEAASH